MSMLDAGITTDLAAGHPHKKGAYFPVTSVHRLLFHKHNTIEEYYQMHLKFLNV